MLSTMKTAPLRSVVALSVLVTSSTLLRAQTTTEATAASTAASTTAETQAPATVEATPETSILGGGALFPDASPANVLAVTQKVFPAVVRLDVAQESFRDGKRTLVRGIGSGVIFDGQGHILTNYHVAGRAVEIFVTLANKERVRGRLVGDDHWTDLAVVQMDMDEVQKKNFQFVYAELGTSHQLVPGQDVIAIGTPFGLARTLTLGVVSNTERTFYPDRQDIEGYETGDFSNWIQMDTPIAPGNSGGPLVDLSGRVVGVNTRGIQGQSLNFAVPIDTALPVVQQILASAEPDRLGRVTRAYIGIDFRPLQDLESFYSIELNTGALISTVDRGSPAFKAGLRAQDILLAINDQPVNVRFPEEISAVKHLIATLPLDEDVKLTVRRAAEKLDLTLRPVKLESRQGEERELAKWGLSVRDVTLPLSIERRLDDDLGAIVTSVQTGFPAQQADLQPGDVIRKINNQPVNDLDALLDVYASLADADQVLVESQRGRGVRSTLLKIKK